MSSVEYFFKNFDIPEVHDEVAYFTGTLGYPQIDEYKFKQLLSIYFCCKPEEVLDELLVGLVSEKDSNYEKVREVFNV